LDRFTLDAKTTLGQGQLAVVANKNDKAMEDIFSLLNYGLIS